MSFEQAKRNAGVYAADFIKTGMTVGLGSGTTVYWLIQELRKRVTEGLHITAVPTSTKTADLARSAGIVLSGLDNISRLSLTIDGADEIDPKGQLIKGGGGALLQEKIVAASSAELIIIADGSKLVPQLGIFPLPVEVIPFGYRQVKEQILNTGLCKNITLRKWEDEIFITDHHHYILDCEFEKIANAEEVNTSLHLIPGVVETGLFISMTTTTVIGHEDGRIEVINYRRADKT